MKGTAAFAGACHPVCFACRDREAGGLGLRFREGPGEGVSAAFDCSDDYQGYPDRLHGGIVALLLDTAMTHCLFARGVQGVTAKLQVRFDAPVRIRTPAVVEAAPVEGANSLRKLRATVTQAGRVCATAEATFVSMQRSRPGGERAGE